MSPVVVDASMAASWLLPDERSDETDDVLNDIQAGELLVPSIFWHEIRSILLMAERRGRTRPDQTSSLLARLDLLDLEDAGHGQDGRVLALARTHQLSAYDAVYLDLATSLHASIATLDKRLAAAAQRAGTPVLGPLAP